MSSKPSYLEVVYPLDEFNPNLYPQKLCDYINSNYLWRYWLGILLDIGSGKGSHMIGFHRCGFKVYGLDKEAYPDDLVVKRCDIDTEPFPFEDDFFDCVFSKSVLEHVWDCDKFMSEAMRVLRPGGVAIIMVPDWESQHSYYWDDPYHLRAYTRRGLQYLMTLSGFKDVKVSWFLQLPFLWKHPWLSFIPKIISILPESCKWRDNEKRIPWKLIRFSKEKMLLGVGYKM